LLHLLTVLLQITSFTVPYFSLTDREPAIDLAPLIFSGIFGVGALGGKSIREEKFSVSWTSDESSGTSLMAAFSPLTHIETTRPHSRRRPIIEWVNNNLRHIWWKWEAVLDALDKQTSLPVSDAVTLALKQS
jgi:hypothetical protein